MSNDKTTARSTTEQPEADHRKRPKSTKRKRQSAKRNRVNQNLEEMKKQYNSTGDVEEYNGTDLEREASQ